MSDAPFDLDALTDYLRGVLDCTWFMVRHLPASAALLAARAASSLEVAYTMHQTFVPVVFETAHKAMHDAGAPWFAQDADPAVWPEQVDDVAWDTLARGKNEPVDFDD